MNKTLNSALVCLSLVLASVPATLQAQGYNATAQLTYQAVGDGTYNYSILLQNDPSSTESINTFWFAWVPDYYGYDLLSSNPNVTGTPGGWYGYVQNGNGYTPDGYSIDFYDYGSSYDLAPGQSDTFTFNSADSPATLMQNSPYYNIPTLTSYTYGSSGDSQQFVVSIAPVPEPSTAGLIGIGALGLVVIARRRYLNLVRIGALER